MWGDIPFLAVPPAARRSRASKRDHAELDGAEGDEPAAPRRKPTKRSALRKNRHQKRIIRPRGAPENVSKKKSGRAASLPRETPTSGGWY